MNWTIANILLCSEGSNRFTVCGFRGWVGNLEWISQKAFRKDGSTVVLKSYFTSYLVKLLINL